MDTLRKEREDMKRLFDLEMERMKNKLAEEQRAREKTESDLRESRAALAAAASAPPVAAAAAPAAAGDVPPPPAGLFVAPPPPAGLFVAPPPPAGLFNAPPPPAGLFAAPPPPAGLFGAMSSGPAAAPKLVIKKVDKPAGAAKPAAGGGGDIFAAIRDGVKLKKAAPKPAAPAPAANAAASGGGGMGGMMNIAAMAAKRAADRQARMAANGGVATFGPAPTGPKK
jgi:hypothetical protein